jgi:hypothetical protein
MMMKRRARGRSSSKAWALVALPLCAVACSSSSSPAGGGGAGDDGGAGDSGVGLDAGAIDPSLNPDPRDLDPAKGDPSLDIAGSQIYFDKDQPWVRAVFYGAWPPAATIYSWACSVSLGTANAPLVTYTVQGTKGVQTTDAQGIPLAQVTLATEPRGFRVLFASTTLVFDRYALECDVQVQDNGGTMLQDSSGAFVITTKMQKAFGP